MLPYYWPENTVTSSGIFVSGFFFLSVFVVNVHTIVIELLITWSHYDSELSLLHFFQASVNYRNLAIAAVSTFTLF